MQKNCTNRVQHSSLSASLSCMHSSPLRVHHKTRHAAYATEKITMKWKWKWEIFMIAACNMPHIGWKKKLVFEMDFFNVCGSLSQFLSLDEASIMPWWAKQSQHWPRAVKSFQHFFQSPIRWATNFTEFKSEQNRKYKKFDASATIATDVSCRVSNQLSLRLNRLRLKSRSQWNGDYKSRHRRVNKYLNVERD